MRKYFLGASLLVIAVGAGLLGQLIYSNDGTQAVDNNLAITYAVILAVGLVGFAIIMLTKLGAMSKLVARVDRLEAALEDSPEEELPNRFQLEAQLNTAIWEIIDKLSFINKYGALCICLCLQDSEDERLIIPVSIAHKYANDFFFAKIGEKVKFLYSEEDLDMRCEDHQSNHLIPEIIPGVANTRAAA